MGTDKQKELLARFRQRCREQGIKITPKRVLIYEELIRSKDHPSPEVLFKRVQVTVPRISLDTVYRTLATFHEMGLVDMVEGFALTKRFDPNQEQIQTNRWHPYIPLPASLQHCWTIWDENRMSP